MKWLLPAALVIAAAVPSPARAAGPLIVAVDSSRSLRPSDMRAIHDAVARGLEAVPGDVPVGLVTFDDAARWVVEPTSDRSRVLDALAAVEPEGTTTVLYDGLYLAAAATEHGALLAVSDGRDENSAVTVEDVEQVCLRRDVVVLTAGVGKTVDDKALRRLALLTRGEFLGPTADSIATGLGPAYARLRPTAPGPPTTSAPPAHEPAPAGGGAGPETAPVRSMRLVPWVVGFAALAIIACVVLVVSSKRRHRAANGGPRCPVCGAPVALDGGECAACRNDAIRNAAEAIEVAREAAEYAPSDLGIGAMAFETRPEGADRTVALGEVAVVEVREEGEPPREFTLPRDRIFAVGRAPKVNTLQVRDQTVSAQHFKIVFKEGRYYVVDLWTTNGTSVNHECIRVHPLESGDVIRAGLTEFVFTTRGHGVVSKS